MKKVILLFFLIFGLNGCATAPSGDIQSSLIEEGFIKVGMNSEVLYNTLGGSGASYFTWLKVNKEYPHMYIIPSLAGWDNKYYVSEQIISGKNSKIKNYNVVKIFDDPVEMYDYYLKILPDGKSKSNILKWKASYLTNSSYLEWKYVKDKKITKTKVKKKKLKDTQSEKKKTDLKLVRE